VTAPRIDLLDRSLVFAEVVLATIGRQGRDRPTPCPRYSVETLAAHLIGGLDWFAALPLGGPVDARRVADPSLAGSSLAVPFLRAAGSVRVVWTPERLAGRYLLPGGPVSGDEVAGAMAMEAIGHGWDLAVATGSPARPDDALVTEVLELVRELDRDQALRTPQLLGAPVPVPDGAPLAEQLAGFLGRDPQLWR
jgi:uncharacterized protein (TIGR03086 family)